MRAFPVLAGGLAYLSGYQWDIVPDTMASIAVIAAFYAVVSDIWSDPAPASTQRRIERLVAETEPRLNLGSTDDVMQQITSQPSEMDPEVLLSQLLDEDDQLWLKEQVKMIVEEKA